MIKNSLCALLLAPALLLSHQAKAVTEEQIESSTLSLEVAKSELREKLSLLNTFKSDFSQVVKASDGEVVQSATGNLLLQKPNMLIWNNVEPEEMTIQSDGNTLWHFDPFIEQVSVYSIDSAIANTPILLLSSTDDKLWRDYQVSKMSEFEYVIYNSQPDAQVKSLTLVFDEVEQKAVLSSFTLIDSTAQASTFSLTNFKEVPMLPPSKFVFTVPEGVDVDDQR